MRRTVHRHRPPTSPAGDTLRTCGYCGVEWYRSQLQRDAAGILACPDDQSGLDAVSLSKGNADAASHHRMGQHTGDSDGGIDPPNTTPSPGFVNPNGPPVAPANGGPTGALSVFTSLWIRGDSVSLSSAGTVLFWRDMSSRNNDLTAPTLASQPTLITADATLNNLPTVSGDGVNQFIQGATFKASAPLWIWMVAKQVSWVSNAVIYSDGFALRQNTGSPSIALLTNGATTPNGGAAIGQWFRSIASYNIASTDTLQIRGTAVSDASAGQRAGSAFSLFSGFNGAGKSNMVIAELLATVGPPTAAEIAAIEAYGAVRYGLVPFG